MAKIRVQLIINLNQNSIHLLLCVVFIISWFTLNEKRNKLQKSLKWYQLQSWFRVEFRKTYLVWFCQKSPLYRISSRNLTQVKSVSFPKMTEKKITVTFSNSYKSPVKSLKFRITQTYTSSWQVLVMYVTKTEIPHTVQSLLNHFPLV